MIPSQNKYPLSKKSYLEYLERMKKNTIPNPLNLKKSHPFSNRSIIYDDYDEDDNHEQYNEVGDDNDVKLIDENGNPVEPDLYEKQILNLLNGIGRGIKIRPIFEPILQEGSENNRFMNDVNKRKQAMMNNKKINGDITRVIPVLSSEHFTVSKDPKLTFSDIGGYEDIK